jgi:hypothetical protein
MDVLETAYLEVFNHMTVFPSVVTTSRTSNVLNGIKQSNQKGSEESYILKVQFNPARLVFSTGTAPKDDKRTSITRTEEGVVSQADVSNQAEVVTVKITLVFDRSIYKESGIQEEVDGFLAMIQNPYVRKVAFHWGDQYYTGIIKDLEAEYVLFNAVGVPTRANVNFSIQLI